MDEADPRSDSVYQAMSCLRKYYKIILPLTYAGPAAVISANVTRSIFGGESALRPRLKLDLPELLLKRQKGVEEP